MKKKIYLLLSVLISAIFYVVLLWYPFGGWLLENVVANFTFGFSNPNILEGFILMFLALIVLILLFITPFLLFWGIVFFTLLWFYKIKK